MLLGYATKVRGLWISQRCEEDRVRIPHQLTEPVHSIFFARRTPRRIALVPHETRRLRTLLDELDQLAEQAVSSATEPVPATGTAS